MREIEGPILTLGRYGDTLMWERHSWRVPTNGGRPRLMVRGRELPVPWWVFRRLDPGLARLVAQEPGRARRIAEERAPDSDRRAWRKTDAERITERRDGPV